MGAIKTTGEVCAACGGRTYVIERKGDWAQARVCQCMQECPECRGRGHVYAEREETFSQKVGARRYEVLVPCACTLRTRRLARFNAVGLPGVLAHASFENYRAFNEAQDKARGVAMNFAHHFDKKAANKGFILSGSPGTGKTHLLAATIAHLVLEKGVEARFVEISLLFATIRRGFQEGKSGGEIIGPLSEVEVLAIDEIGKGRGSQFELDTLDELIARRYNANRTTLFTTNNSLDYERSSVSTAPTGYRSTEDTKNTVREAELLRPIVGDRIYSRLCEMCTFVELPKGTPDQRRMRQELDPRRPAPTGGARTGR